MANKHRPGLKFPQCGSACLIPIEENPPSGFRYLGAPRPLRRLQNADEFAGLYIGRRQGKDLIYTVDYGFDIASAKDLQARLKPLPRTWPL
jgi:hypothetical protein